MRSRGLLAFTVVVAAIGAAAWFAWRGGGDHADVGSPSRGATPGPCIAESAAGAEAAKSDAATDAAAPQRAIEPIEAADAGPNARRILGRVVDARRFPVVGARVRLTARGCEPREATTHEGGAFEFAFASVGSEYLQAALLAAGPDGALGNGSASLGPDHESGSYTEDQPRDCEAPTITVLQPARLVVHVRDGHGPVVGAEVTADLSAMTWPIITSMLPVVASDADGIARLAVPRCDAIVIASVPRRAIARQWVNCRSAVEQSLELVLHPLCSAKVRVLDSTTRAPVANAHVVLSETVLTRWGSESSYSAPEEVGGSGHLPDLVCGTDGVARIDGFDPERQFGLRAKAPGYETTEGTWAMLDASNRDVELLLAPYGDQAVRIPIVADESPVPPDGTVVGLRVRSFSGEGDMPATATVERGELVIAGTAARRQGAVAKLPDGGVAVVEYGASAPPKPRELRFKRPRTLEVDARYADGRVASGASIRISCPNDLPPPAHADDHGHAVVHGMLPILVQLYACGAPTVGPPLATADLREGDAHVEIVLPERFDATLAVTLDGRPGLPPTFRLSSPFCTWKIEAEDPERGELRVSAAADVPDRKVAAWFVAANYLTVNFELPIVRGAAPPAVPIALVRGATLRLDVKRAPDQKLGLRLQQQDDDGTFANFSGQDRGIDRVNGVNGLFELGPLAAGTWRVRDEVTKIATEPVTLAAGEERTLSLDLSGARVVHGHVDVPAGADLQLVRILARGERTEAETDRFGSVTYPGTRVNPDGTFERTIDGSNPFVRAWHPSLAPPPGDPYFEVRDAARTIELALVDRPALSFTVARADGAIHVSGANRSNQLAITLDREDGDHAHVLRSFATTGAATEVVKLAEIAAGRWTLLLDPGGEAAPLLRSGIEVTDGGTDLGTLAFGSGSTLHVQLADSRAKRSGFIQARARHVGAPDYSRFWERRAGPELLFAGLGAGRFEVELAEVTGQQLWTGTADCDGAHETALSVELH